MAKHRAGLHKEITSIFEGVPIPKSNGVQHSSAAHAPDNTSHVPPKPPAPAPQIPTTPKPQQPVQAPSKAAPAKQPKADVAVKTAGQAPWQQTWEQIKNKLFTTPKQGVSSTRQKAMVVLVPGLFIVLIFVFTKVLGTSSPKTAGPSSFEPTNTVAASAHKIDWQIPEPYPTTLRDPMRISSVTIAQAGTSKLIIKSIVYSEANQSTSSTSIGNQIVHEGEKVLGATITKINKDSVEFEMNGKTWTQKVQR